MKIISKSILIGCIIVVCVNTSFAQQQDETEKLKKRLDSLEQEFSKLSKSIEAKEQKDKLKELMQKASQLSMKEKEEKDNTSKKFHSGIRQQQGLNPNISVSGDFFYGISSANNELINEPSEFSYGHDGFFMREMELSLIAPLDPFTRGKAFFSLSEGEIEIEEAYMELLNLPLHMNLKAGIFKSEFGLLNRYHTHALPQFDIPRVILNYFGTEGVGGAGIAASFLLPKPLLAHATSLDFSVIRGGEDISFTSEGRQNLIYTGHFKNFYEINDNSYFEFTISEVLGKNDSLEKYYSSVTSLGLHYKWVPVSRSKYRTFDWKTEIYYGYREGIHEEIESIGFYTSIQNKLNARWWISGRIGYSQLPYDKSQYEWDYTLCLDFWQSEFVFYRIQYQYNDRHITDYLNQLGPMPGNHSLIIQISWAMGPHKHESY